MRLLQVNTDASLGLDSIKPVHYKERETARAVIFNEKGQIALLHVANQNYHKLQAVV